MKTIFVMGFVTLTIISCNSATSNKGTVAAIDSNKQHGADTVKTHSDTANLNANKTILSVTAITTVDDMSEDSGTTGYKYPATLSVDSFGSLGDSIAAFGASYKVWLGLKGWTGKGVVGADGNVVVKLYPPGGEDLKGAYISYYIVPACSFCMLYAAAPYFPDAMKDYDTAYNADGKNPVTIPPGIRVTQLSPIMVIYTLPAKNGLLTKGVAIYDASGDGDPYYMERTFVLLEQQSKLLDILVKYYSNDQLEN